MRQETFIFQPSDESISHPVTLEAAIEKFEIPLCLPLLTTQVAVYIHICPDSNA